MEQSSLMNDLINKINRNRARVTVIGLGYVGLPLSILLAERGYSVYGLDIDNYKIKSLNSGKSYIDDVSNEQVYNAYNKQDITFGNDYSKLTISDIIIICVPTPITETNSPNLDYIQSSLSQVEKYIRPGVLVSLESSTYPGTTRRELAERFENLGLTVGQDVFVTYSPERIDPGNIKFKTQDIPKIIGGLTKSCNLVAEHFYSTIIKQTFLVSTPEVAEFSKLLENSFRAVNIGFINELSILADTLDIDIWEAIDASVTKPFGYMPFYPGPGVGGHCIPVDPWYLLWVAEQNQFSLPTLKSALDTNNEMFRYIVTFIENALIEENKYLELSNILLVGISYKENTSDIRESPSLKIHEILNEKAKNVFYFDPYVQKFQHKGVEYFSIELERILQFDIDCVVILTNHSEVNYELFTREDYLVIDTRNVLKQKVEGKVRTFAGSNTKTQHIYEGAEI